MSESNLAEVKKNMKFCVIIPSHIHHITRSKSLITCLTSLINQTVTIPIFLSISFETQLDEKLFVRLFGKSDLTNYPNIIKIVYRGERTSQFRHIKKTMDIVNRCNFDFIMFCDDDDTYQPMRVEEFTTSINYCYNNCMLNGKKLAGMYEVINMDMDCSHLIRIHEYWKYCVHISILNNFFHTIEHNNGDNYIDNKFCDVLFADYLRQLDERHIFIKCAKNYYNYNKHSESITATIQKNKIAKKKFRINNIDLIEDLNRLIQINYSILIDNIIFLKFVYCKDSFNDIMKKYVLREYYKYMPFLDQEMISNIQNRYNHLRDTCYALYQNK